jgi:hypothetical protein
MNTLLSGEAACPRSALATQNAKYCFFVLEGARHSIGDISALELAIPLSEGLIKHTAELGLGLLLVDVVNHGDLVVEERGNNEVGRNHREPEEHRVLPDHHPRGQVPRGHGLHIALGADERIVGGGHCLASNGVSEAAHHFFIFVGYPKMEICRSATQSMKGIT